MIKDLLEKIQAYEKSIESINDVLRELSSKKNELKKELKKVCDHPDEHVSVGSEGFQDDYGSWSGTDYWFHCNQCGCESAKSNWDRDQRGEHRLGSRRPIAEEFYKELTKRPLPKNKGPI